ncbi:hypothetical protein GWI33_011565 [Rhynchophorus ferrugineus]|uniref:Uncharacterized protein n=1 Tax=Rhynchophorus ferrugineus TaxID=354439 RepID=A0A834IRR1_RHYFE|nr:hypothetical protein GWI33_011565 [Rhynchophorus ferrugineus]
MSGYRRNDSSHIFKSETINKPAFAKPLQIAFSCPFALNFEFNYPAVWQTPIYQLSRSKRGPGDASPEHNSGNNDMFPP